MQSLELNDENRPVLARAYAINAYANLESSLCYCFNTLLGTEPQYGSIVFYKITNSRARNAMLEKLLKVRHKAKYNLFWNSIDKLLRQVDETRNQIVHWVVVTTVTENYEIGVSKHGVNKLMPPNPFGWGENPPALGEAELVTFIELTGFLSRLINVFHLSISENMKHHIGPPWPEIFLAPVEYPPPLSHPLHPNYVAPSPPPEPSE